MWSVYGRRGALVNNLLGLFFMIIIRLRSSFFKLADRMRIYYTGLLLIILFLAFGYLFMSTYVFQRGFNKYAFEESRGIVFEGFFNDFSSTSEWIFGRGLNGTVFRDINSVTRFTEIENGFLTIVLKGGLLYLIPYILILLRAGYLGFFRSKNDIVKAMASIVLIQLIMMSSFGLPAYSSKYIFIWICVSVCFTSEIRNLSNDAVYQAINFSF